MGKFEDTFGEFAHTFDPDLRRAFEVSDSVEDVKDYSKVRIEKDNVLLSGDGIFYTLQGEGPTTGFPCVFVRLHVCNLRCTWCDAFYTWKMDSREFWTESYRMEFSELAQAVQKEWSANTHSQTGYRVIFTGGEPLIQRKQLDQVVNALNGGPDWDISEPKWAVEFETNGTLMPTQEQLNYAQFNCSPKLANSDNLEHAMWKPKVLQALNKVDTTFKFVCMTEDDLKEIEKNFLSHIDEEKIIIMPQGITEKEVSDNAKVLVEDVKKRGWRLQTRLQNVCWDGARRGV